MAAPSAVDQKNPASTYTYPASETALFLMDYQNMILPRLPDESTRKTVIATAVSLRDWALENNILIIHCLIDTKSSPLANHKITERWPIFEKILSSGPSMGEEIAQLRPTADADPGKEQVFTRRPGTFSALKSDGLRELLDGRGIRSLVLAGLSTSGVVLSTGRAAPDEGFVTTVVKEACADPAEGIHDALCNVVLVPSVHVVDLATLQREWRARQG